ncbi:hypothetical protein CERZMDRAFT_85378 [Cercospora zeae-maydis SCOH1-5]|uniref:Uncharacterized protein n=1 Tax=Cercospora zeae-maydis SCOH1-5 TaxID=717836 RepID=A0A6A6FDY5_9PEZI|nr:hypothetical protein CERZMDRAFT_85378 [Cercospora zeae-maydis SCOH1-5]
MNGSSSVPNAWDDDWEKAADNPARVEKESAPKLSKAARKAQHIEQNKLIWDSADNPARNHWLEAQGVVPLKQEYQVPVTLLSRKPPTIAKRDVAGGVAGISLDDDEDSEDERRKKREADFEERQRKAKIEREEKQKRYAEARERIMGSSRPALAPSSRESSQGREGSRRGRGKQMSNGTSRRSQPQSSAEQSPARNAARDQQLFDPEDMGRRMKREPSNTTPKEDLPMRQPRGPDQSGRGGFGFGNRGGMLPP